MIVERREGAVVPKGWSFTRTEKAMYLYYLPDSASGAADYSQAKSWRFPLDIAALSAWGEEG